MAYQNSTVSFEKMLMKFISDEDPMQSMLKWLWERLMEAEVENKLCAEKSERNNERQGYRSGYWRTILWIWNLRKNIDSTEHSLTLSKLTLHYVGIKNWKLKKTI